MGLSKFIKTSDKLGPYCLVLSLFIMPLSSTARSIILPIAFVCILLNDSYRTQLKGLLLRPFVLFGLALFTIACIGMLWGNANLHEKWLVFEKYTKLLFLPILVVGFSQRQTRLYAKTAFLAAMFITTVIMLAKASGFTTFGGQDPGKIFHNHILTGYMLAFAAYLSATLVVHKQGFIRAVYAANTLLLSYTVLFVCTGRMAYIAYMLMMLVWFFETFPIKHAFILGVGFFTCFSLMYQINPMMQFLMHQAQDDVTSFTHGHKNTSLGLRLQFHQYTYQKLFKTRPLLGHGTGGFSASFARDEPIKDWKEKIIWEPHSQYWLIAAEYGLFGLILFGAFILSALLEGVRVPGNCGFTLAIMLPFIIGNLTDSLLLYSGTGYFFLIFLAMGMSTRLRSSSTLYNQADVTDGPAPHLIQAKRDAIQT